MIGKIGHNLKTFVLSGAGMKLVGIKLAQFIFDLSKKAESVGAHEIFDLKKWI